MDALTTRKLVEDASFGACAEVGANQLKLCGKLNVEIVSPNCAAGRPCGASLSEHYVLTTVNGAKIVLVPFVTMLEPDGRDVCLKGEWQNESMFKVKAINRN